MGFFSDIGGMLPAAYAGFQQGADAEVARQKRESDAAYQEELRAREREMAPLAAEAQKSRLQSQIDQSKRDAQIAPKQHELDMKKLDAASELLPGQLDLAKGEQKMALDQMVGKQIQQVMQGAKTEAEVENYLLASAGEAIARGDTASLNRIFGHMVDAPRVFPGLNGMQAPVKSEVVTAPEGSKDFTGQPISGPAIQLTMPDGTKQFATTKYIASAYQKHLAAQNLAGSKIVKPGERWVNADGTVRAEGSERAYGGLVQDEDGNWIDMRPRAGGSGSAGSRSGGKAPASPQSVAVEFFATAAEKAETKLTPTQIAYGQRLAEQIATQRNESGQPIPPAIAAEVAMEVALDPAKIQPQVNVRSGKIEGVFSRRDLGDVVVEPWSPALQKSFTPEQLTKAAEELVKAQPPAVRTEFFAAAHDPAARKALIDKVTQEIASKVPEDQVAAYTQATVASLNEKLDIVGGNTKPPKKTDNSSRSSLLGVGGMSAPPSYAPPPDSPAGRALARREEVRQRQEAEQSRAQAAAQQKAAAQQELSQQFRSDMKSMDPLELARKYDSMRGRLPTQDAAALQQIERTIR